MARQLGRVRSLLTVVGWFAAVSGATTVGVLAVDAIGSGIAGTTAEPLTGKEVASQLATASPASSKPISTESSPANASRVLGTKGGTIVARCTDGRVYLASWSPAQGYEADNVRRGPARTAGLQFESDDAELHVRISCERGVPNKQVKTEYDD